jgi:hypothetical protein
MEARACPKTSPMQLKDLQRSSAPFGVFPSSRRLLVNGSATVRARDYILTKQTLVRKGG